MSTVEKTIAIVLAVVLAAAVLFLAALKTGWINLLRPSVDIYVLREAEGGAAMVRVSRTAPGLRGVEARVRYSVEKLLEGLTDEEEKAGYLTSIPAGAKLLACSIENGTAFIDFSADIESGGGTAAMEERLAQIVFTATQFPGVETVRFKIDGKLIEYFGGEGITDVERPLGRDHFTRFLEGGAS